VIVPAQAVLLRLGGGHCHHGLVLHQTRVERGGGDGEKGLVCLKISCSFL